MGKKYIHYEIRLFFADGSWELIDRPSGELAEYTEFRDARAGLTDALKNEYAGYNKNVHIVRVTAEVVG
jgi:hypothetical protein